MYIFNKTIRQLAMLATGSALVVSSHAAITVNALSNNALSNNALSNNALSNNALSNNALSNNALSNNAITSKAADLSAQRVDTDLSARPVNGSPVGAYTPSLSWETLQVRPWPPAVETK